MSRYATHLRLTPSQARAIAYIARELERHHFFSKIGEETRYEFKRFDVLQFEGSSLVFVHAESGLKGDEATMASVHCRDRRNLVIGPHGAIRLMNAKAKRNTARSWAWALVER